MIKYVLRDVVSDEYITCYFDEYTIDGENYSELVAYTTELGLEFVNTYDTYSEAEYYKQCISAEFEYDVEIVRIEE